MLITLYKLVEVTYILAQIGDPERNVLNYRQLNRQTPSDPLLLNLNCCDECRLANYYHW